MSVQETRKPDLITYDTAAEILGVRPRTLQLRILKDGLTRYRSPIDRRNFFLDRAEVEQLLDFEVITPQRPAA